MELAESLAWSNSDREPGDAVISLQQRIMHRTC